MSLLKRIMSLKKKKDAQTKGVYDDDPATSLYPDEPLEVLEKDMHRLMEEIGTRGETVQREAEKEIQTATEETLKRLHAQKRGRCPVCSTPLRQHLSTSICDSCGWHTFDFPRSGGVKVHLSNSDDKIEGEKCYFLKTGELLVINRDVVSAKIPSKSVNWVDYCWEDLEIEERHKHLVERMTLRCDWCNSEADLEKDGFHSVHVAFGASQARYCFCQDECFESFKKMYPSRVDRNCYERDCAECDLCVKRYDEDSDAIRMLAKDYLTTQSKKG